MKLFAASSTCRGSFRFDGRFLLKKGVREEIKKAWQTNHPLFETKVSDRLKRYRKSLSNWKKKEKLNSRDKIKQIQCALELEQSALVPMTVKINFLKAEFVQSYKEEDLYWKQRCKERWAVKGDMNTKFYHASVKSNRSRKKLIKLMDARGQLQFEEDAKGDVAKDYFTNLFKSTTSGDFSELFEGFTKKVSAGMNETLSREVSIE